VIKSEEFVSEYESLASRPGTVSRRPFIQGHGHVERFLVMMADNTGREVIYVTNKTACTALLKMKLKNGMIE